MFAFSFVDRINLLRTKLTAKLRSLPQTTPYLEITFIFFSLYTNPACLCAKSLQSCPTIRNTMDCSPPGSPVHGILQARILEWITISSSSRSPRPRDGTDFLPLLHWQAGSLPLVPPGEPHHFALFASNPHMAQLKKF